MTPLSLSLSFDWLGWRQAGSVCCISLYVTDYYLFIELFFSSILASGVEWIGGEDSTLTTRIGWRGVKLMPPPVAGNGLLVIVSMSVLPPKTVSPSLWFFDLVTKQTHWLSPAAHAFLLLLTSSWGFNWCQTIMYINTMWNYFLSSICRLRKGICDNIGPTSKKTLLILNPIRLGLLSDSQSDLSTPCFTIHVLFNQGVKA